MVFGDDKNHMIYASLWAGEVVCFAFTKVYLWSLKWDSTQRNYHTGITSSHFAINRACELRGNNYREHLTLVVPGHSAIWDKTQGKGSVQLPAQHLAVTPHTKPGGRGGQHQWSSTHGQGKRIAHLEMHFTNCPDHLTLFMPALEPYY